jgi:hypothetical protein
MRLSWILLVLVFGANCRLADETLLDRLADGGSGVDAPTGEDVPTTEQVAVDQCGADDVMVLTETTLDILIDTTTLTAQNTQVTCAESRGNDGFLAVEVNGGEFWHFHLRTESAASDRNPVLYLLTDGCDTRSCVQLSDTCSANRDEHFGFIPTGARQTWFIGIDDANEGGGRYLLDAIKPTCGNGSAEHGESCDGQEACNDDCRYMITSDSVQERIPNDNFQEANEIVLDGNQLELRGDMGGIGDCNYPDVYTILVPDGAQLEVVARDESSMRCMTTATAPFSLTLLNAAGTTRGGGEDGNGCPVIDQSGLPGGRYFVRLVDQRLDRSGIFNYRLFFRLTP